MRATCLLGLFAAAVATAAPPVAPAELKADVGKPTLLSVTVEKGKKLGTERTFDPAALMLARLWTDDPSVYEFWVFPNTAGTFYVPFWTEGETKGVVVKVVAGGGAKPDPVKPPPVEPPPVTPAKYHFMLVRLGNVGIDPKFEAVMNLPGWKDIKAAGHTYADYPLSSLPPKTQAKFAGQPLPFLLKWTYSGEQIVLPEDAVAGAVPTNDEQIRGLLK